MDRARITVIYLCMKNKSKIDILLTTKVKSLIYNEWTCKVLECCRNLGLYENNFFFNSRRGKGISILCLTPHIMTGLVSCLPAYRAP